MQAQAKPGTKPSWILILAAGVSFCVGLTACSSQNKPQSQPQETKRFPLHGKVVSIDKAQKKLEVDHDAIPGFMGAMAMPYPVKDERLLEGLAPGDEITAQVVVGDGVWLENIVVVKKGEKTESSPASQLHQLVAGEEPPDFVLLNQDSKRVSLGRYRSKALLITFIYTRCPFPDFCPLMTRNFQEIEKALAKDPEAYAKTHLLSISFDPEYDTPKVLRAYGLKYVSRQDAHAFDHWEFAAAPLADAKKIASFFGFRFEKESGEFEHGLNTTIISPDGKIYKWYYGSDWKPEDVLKDLKSSLAGHNNKLTGSA
jgi:protein SCO1/2